MSLFSWFGGLFGRRPEAPRLVLGGKAVWWPTEALPLNVWIDGAWDDRTTWAAFMAVRRLPTLRPLMLPVSLEKETRNTFFSSRETFRNAIVIQPDVMTSAAGAFRCSTDIRFDKRTGEMRNALIAWNLVPGDAEGNIKRLVHELGHCLGLGHCDGTAMQAHVSDWSTVGGFNDAQAAYLRGLRR